MDTPGWNGSWKSICFRQIRESVRVPAQAEYNSLGLNQERADPALIICLITAAYEGFSDFYNQVLPYLTI